MRRLRLMLAALVSLCLCVVPSAWGAASDHPTQLPSPLIAASPPARSFVGGTPSYPSCPTFGLQLVTFKFYLSTVGPTDPGTLAGTASLVPAPLVTTWTCPTPLPDGTYYLRVTLVDVNGVEGEKNAALSFIIGTPPSTFPLTTSTTGTGAGTVAGAGNYAAGAPVTLIATPDANSVLSAVTPPPCAVTTPFAMPAAPLLCTVAFTLKPPAVIGIGSTVFVNTLVNQALNVRPGPTNTVPPSCAVCPTQPRGASGVVVAGPVVANGITWWQIDYATGADGWSSGVYLSLTPPSP